MGRDDVWRKSVEEILGRVNTNLNILEARQGLTRRVERSIDVMSQMKGNIAEADNLASRYPDPDSRIGRKARKAQDASRENFLRSCIALERTTERAVEKTER